ncbi:unnamed protein product, partial [Rodentolepis nana]|uniref:GGDEF domain-containing protein n=1 Tax=Rodentolepis nana TaxID=102285 RepID=A0A0R3TIJ1_RODNA
MLYQNPIFCLQAFHRELSQAALFAFINDIAELVQKVTEIKCLINGDGLVLWYFANKINAQERTESALNCALKLLWNGYQYRKNCIPNFFLGPSQHKPASK